MLGIVIANWNGEKLIDKCLESLENQSFKDFKVYIIDNDSKDNSKEVIRNYDNKLKIDLTEMNYNSGFAPANNIGIKKAIKDGCNYILTLNNDVDVPKDSLENAMKAIENNKNFDVFQLFMINYFNKDKKNNSEVLYDSNKNNKTYPTLKVDRFEIWKISNSTSNCGSHSFAYICCKRNLSIWRNDDCSCGYGTIL